MLVIYHIQTMPGWTRAGPLNGTEFLVTVAPGFTQHIQGKHYVMQVQTFSRKEIKCSQDTMKLTVPSNHKMKSFGQPIGR